MSLTPLNKTEYANYLIKKSSAGRKFVTMLDKKGAILPVLLLEATVTGGRTYQAYKRDGFVEARERVTEESLGAIFWLFGATMAGKLFDKIGQTFMKVPKNMPDVGRDGLRTPYNNFINKTAAILRIPADKKELLSKNLAKFAVGKTFASLITACLFIGYVVPKVNQAITKHLYGRMSKKDPNHEKGPNPYTNRLTIKDARAIFSAKGVSINAVENFKAHKDLAPANSTTAAARKDRPSFKGGADSLLRIVQNFEENDIWKLMGTDVGTVTGRTANARNKDERVEILFRDLSSIYFYCFSMPAIVAFMNKKDSFKGLNTKLNPMSAMQVHNSLVQKMADMGIKEMTPEAFSEAALGNDENYKKLYEKIFPKQPEPQAKKILGFIKVKPEKVYRTISVEEFEKIVDKNASDLFASAKAEDKQTLIDALKAKAKQMSALQPEKLKDKNSILKEKVLTESQVEDVLKGGWAREPEFLKGILNDIFEDKIIDPFKEKSTAKRTNPLSNPYKYIPLSDIEDRRQRILGYVQSIVEEAKNRKGNVDFESMLKLNKRNTTKNGLFMGLAMGVSALFLSTIIPKIQYYITYLRTGKNSFPGTEDMKEQ